VSITVEIDTAQAFCRSYISSWNLWTGQDTFPYFDESLGWGYGADLPYQATQYGLIPGREYCYVGHTSYGGGYNGWGGDCFRTKSLTIFW
jgi:hypothetical protein